ncbi:type II toxin-antitoxin system VapC family toxin [Synechococcus sp. CS-1328]|uniref:type II toxin-antitoxin system VapC family toxin n=1 Tax=Synechococcus sp. CS-1328 TaxID=2847976 RepID=UPI00223AEA36|nr:type II toxin-antitoxin system VapC family toxin [Synechococcus sp. CS-1328]MCT0225749.1 type II toxin-antitoxin system VapC family toxin [Synechococcus sp. CS-1328]
MDTCILVSLFLPDSGSDLALQWLNRQESRPIWLSHWSWLEFAGVLALCCRRDELDVGRVQVVHQEADVFRRECLGLVEPVGADFFQARLWMQLNPQSGLRSADALHLAIAQRAQLQLLTADRALLQAAAQLSISGVAYIAQAQSSVTQR